MLGLTNELKEALAHYICLESTDSASSEWRVLPQQGHGTNNTTSFVERDGERYVVRIYETHQDEQKVLSEHSVLLALAGVSKPFRTPELVLTKEQQTVVRLSSGKLAAMFQYMEGDRPAFGTLDQLRRFGRTAGQLTLAMAEARPDRPPAYNAYYELEQVHPLCTPEAVLAFCERPPGTFSSELSALRAIHSGFETFMELRPRLESLPHQLIHGDLNSSNLLSDGADGAITAVLDFEFATRDTRVMESAVCLSDLIDLRAPQSELWSRLEAFAGGYLTAVPLTDEEIGFVPRLMALRRLEVFVHFLGRYLDGVDTSEQFIKHLRGIQDKLEWCETNAGRLVETWLRLRDM